MYLYVVISGLQRAYNVLKSLLGKMLLKTSEKMPYVM